MPPLLRIFAIASLFGCLLLLGVECSGRSAGEAEPEGASSSEHSSEAPSSTDSSSLPVDSLSEAQRQRLGPTLQRFLTADSTTTRRIEAVGERDGEKTYSVLIRSQKPEALREAGIPLTSIVGETITARLTVEEILTAASTDGVQSIRTDRQLEPHQ